MTWLPCGNCGRTIVAQRGKWVHVDETTKYCFGYAANSRATPLIVSIGEANHLQSIVNIMVAGMRVNDPVVEWEDD